MLSSLLSLTFHVKRPEAAESSYTARSLSEQQLRCAPIHLRHLFRCPSLSSRDSLERGWITRVRTPSARPRLKTSCMLLISACCRRRSEVSFGDGFSRTWVCGRMSMKSGPRLIDISSQSQRRSSRVRAATGRLHSSDTWAGSLCMASRDRHT